MLLQSRRSLRPPPQPRLAPSRLAQAGGQPSARGSSAREEATMPCKLLRRRAAGGGARALDGDSMHRHVRVGDNFPGPGYVLAGAVGPPRGHAAGCVVVVLQPQVDGALCEGAGAAGSGVRGLRPRRAAGAALRVRQSNRGAAPTAGGAAMNPSSRHPRLQWSFGTVETYGGTHENRIRK